jgi:phenylacetaldehyde dehydrogenase
MTAIMASSGAAAFVARVSTSLYINGEWVDALSNNTVEVLDPSDGQPIATVASAGAEDVDRAVRAARAAFDDGPWRSMSARERGRLIARLSVLIDEHRDVFAELEALDNGKPVEGARAGDVEKAVEWFEYFAGWPTKLQGETIPGPSDERLIYTLRQPVGVVGQIIPWNYPLMMAAWKLAPALAAGCTVVLKPAEQTPLSALYLANLATEAGFPPGVINVITGYGHETGALLVDHPGVNKIAFTGSTVTGQAIIRGSASHLHRITVELGGNSADIVLADADVSTVGAYIADAAFANHGQNCCAGTRLFAARAIADDVIAEVSRVAKAIRLGPGLDRSSQMGPLISARQLERVERLVRGGEEAGAQIVAGGGRPSGVDPGGFFFEPTVIVEAADDLPVVRDEIFGPVITVLPYDTIDEVVRRANASEYGLAAGIWTHDLSAAHTVARRLDAGTVWINTYNETSPAVPFGGFKHSGFGREHGSAVLEHYTERKSVWVAM